METDVPNDQVVVKGVIDPAKLVEHVYKRTGKQASIVPNEEKKQEEEKKEGEKKEEKKEEAKKEGGEDGDKEEDDKNKSDIKRVEYWPSRYYSEYAYYPNSQIFSDENPNACSVM